MNLKYYLIKAHKFLVSNKVFVLLAASLYILLSISTVASHKSFDPYGLNSWLAAVVLYGLAVYTFLLPVFAYKKIKNDILDKKSVVQLIFKNTGRILKATLVLFTYFALYVGVLYLVFDVLLHVNFVQDALAETKDNHGFGFYPANAIFWVITTIFVVPFYFFSIFYFIEKQGVWLSLKRSVQSVFRHDAFFVPLLMIYGFYIFVCALFLPEGNYYFLFLKGILDAYLETLIIVAVLLLYKNHYEVEEAIKSVTIEQMSKGARWSLVGAFIVLAEIVLFLILAYLSAFFSWSDDATGVGVIIYLPIALSVPVLSILFFRKRSKAVIGSFLTGTVVLLIGVFVGFGLLPEEQSQQQTVTTTHTKLTSENLLKAINNKRKENNFKPLAYDPSTCSLAKSRVNEIVEKGVGLYGNSASFQRAIDRMFREDTSIDAQKSPDWYNEYLTYEETVEDSIRIWESGDAKLLFNDKQYQYGCVAVKDGFAIIIVSFYYSSELQTKPEDINTPLDYEEINTTLL